METVKFEELQIDERILRAITDMGFEAASPIQAQSIPVEMEGLDMIGQAQTGTGKTAAFGIPLLQKIDPDLKKLQAVALCPTRELAIQVSEELRRLAKYMHGIKVLPVYGGADIVKQIRALKDGTQIIVGTPGRVMDHMRRKTVKFQDVHTVILDEADEMLNMGFLEDMETILSQLPQERQTVMFSATMPPEIAEIAKRFQKSPVTVRVVKRELTVPKVTQYYYEVKPKNKLEVMCRLLDMYDPKLSVVFCNTKKQVDELVGELQGRGYYADGIHGDLKQEQRDRVMASFRKGNIEILVATDIAARGIDVDDVEAVFNYDIPQDDEYYVHRIGRTGRAGKEGKAFSLVVGREVYKLRDIQRYCKTKMIPQAIPSLDDVTEIKAEKFLAEAGELIADEDSDLTRIVSIIERKLLEEEYTSLDLAAALLKMAMGDGSEEISEAMEMARDLDDLDRFDRNQRGRNGRRNGGRRDDEEFDGRSSRRFKGGDSGMARLFINIGKDQKVRPGDILGAITGETGMPGRMVGSIDMYDKYTFVEVPREYSDAVLLAMKHCKIKGKTIQVEKANRR
ncbi:MAG: DEAD/DEAH box helicase [bacterium]|nr:DEAD/DEAH box helicase [bacterium]